MDDEWQVVKKASGAPPLEIRPLVSLSLNSIGFNSHFAKHAEIEKFRYVTMYVLPAKYKLGFRFHNDKTDRNAYTILKQKRIQATHLYSRHPWLPRT